MSENSLSEALIIKSEKPAQVNDNDAVKFPPFPVPGDDDFDEDISEEERNLYKNKFPDINAVKSERLHCTACDRHLGCAPRNEARMRQHPMLRTLVCNSCHTFYNSGEFEKGDDGSELYCRWCGQGGQVYCCSDCPHVFCAKCVKRNFGMAKIKEIENTDDWKCFKCNPNCLWEIRAVCWALLRYCDIRNKLTFQTQDQKLKEEYQKACNVDDSECCKHKAGRKRKEAEKEPKRKETDSAKKAANAIAKIPATIQVKKFASINLDEQKEKKVQKRSASPKNNSVFVRSPMAIPHRMINPVALPPMAKRMRMPNLPMVSPPFRFQPKVSTTYSRMRPKPPMAMLNNFNGFANSNIINNMVVNDNINLSLESLTQGLDMSSVVGMTNNLNNDVVCTPDFPMEPLCEATRSELESLLLYNKKYTAYPVPGCKGCLAFIKEVTEDNNDDDVQCITPGPAAPPVPSSVPPPLVPRFTPTLNDLTPDNIIQMTENDVTVNAATGGLKFRVDPQTLSANKMYRLPDGRIFAINANPNMPGGYSATIVAVTEANAAKPATPKGSMYAAKLSAVSSRPVSSPMPSRRNRNQATRVSNKKKPKQVNQKSKATEASSRQVDLKVPIEWYRFNLVDAVDSLQYSLSRLQKLKKEATSMFLRTRRLDEIRSLHKTLDRLLNTSCTRFTDIRNNLNKEYRQFLVKKTNNARSVSDEEDDDDNDDDVEILNDNENDDPIFIDENSLESFGDNEANGNTTHEVDLTGRASSENNNSAEKLTDSYEKDPLIDDVGANDNISISSVITKSVVDSTLNNATNISEINDDDLVENIFDESLPIDDGNVQTKKEIQEEEINGEETKNMDEISKEPVTKDSMSKNIGDELSKNDLDIKDGKDQDIDLSKDKVQDIEKDKDEVLDVEVSENKVQNMIDIVQDIEDKTQDTEMSEELIDNLLNDDGGEDDSHNLNCVDIAEEIQES